MEFIGEDGGIDLSQTRILGEVRNGYSYFANGDVVLAKVTPCFENGKGAPIRELSSYHGFGTTELTVLRPHNPQDQDFIWWLTASAAFRMPAQAEMLGAGGLKRVPDQFIASFPIAWPTSAERSAIATFLDRETARIDALIEEQQRLIELLKEKRQAVISHAVTKGLDPTAPMKDSGVEWLGDVPAHWEVTRLANLFREVSEPLTEDLPLLSVSIHHGVSDDELDEGEMDRKVSRSEDRSKYKRVRPKDIVYNMMRAWQGGFGTVSVHGGVSPAYVVARPKRPLETAFVEWVLRTPQCVEEMRTRSVGVTDFRLRLYWEEFRELTIALPPVAEQQKAIKEIGEEVGRYQTLADTAKAAVALLEERRSALISAAVTGKIDVRGPVPTPSHIEAA
jgi:type I restriction enzyme S subunit